MLAPYNMRWVEEPVISDDLHAYAELKALNIVNISGGEHHGFRDALDLKAFESQTCARRTTLWSSLMPARCTTTTSPCRAMPGRSRNPSPRFRSKSATSLFWYIFDGEPVAKDGFIDLSDTAPGFGLTLKPDANFKLTR